MTDERVFTPMFIVGFLTLFLFWVGFPWYVSGITDATVIRLLTWVVILVGYTMYKRRRLKRGED